MEKQFLFVGNWLKDSFKNVLNVHEAIFKNDAIKCAAAFNLTNGIIVDIDARNPFSFGLPDSDDPNGIKIIKALRLSGLTIPVLFVSGEERQKILEEYSGSEIINAVGHDYLKLPVSPKLMIDQLDNLDPLGDLELYDIQNSKCSRGGMADYLAHKVASDNTIMRSSHFTDVLKKIAVLYKEDSQSVINEFKKKFSSLDEQNRLSACDFVKAYANELIQKFPDDPSKKQKIEKRNGTILWIDDELDIKHNFAIELGGYVNLVHFKNASEALKFLEEDQVGSNNVRLILADYWLYEDQGGVKIQQKIQGYRLLKEIAKASPMISFAALSALPKDFLLKSFRYLGINAQIFSKDLLASKKSRNVLIDDLVELGDEMEEAIISMPIASAGWERLSLPYRQFRNSANYHIIEQQVIAECNENVNYFNIHSKFETYLRVNKSPIVIKTDPEVNIRSLKDYLIARRMALWLSAVKKFTAKDVVLKMKGDSNGERAFLNQSLALLLRDFPFSITIEEKKWFQNYTNVRLYRDIELTFNILNQIAYFFQKTINTSGNYKQQIVKQEYAAPFQILSEDGNIDGEIIFTKDFLPILKSFNHAQTLYKGIRDDERFKRLEVARLARAINAAITYKIENSSNVSDSIWRFSRFFKRQLRETLTYYIPNSAKVKVEEFLENIQNGNKFDIDQKDEFTMDLCKKTLIAFAECKSKGLVPSDISIFDLLDEVAIQYIQDTKFKSESDKLTKYNYTKSNNSRIDYVYPEELED